MIIRFLLLAIILTASTGAAADDKWIMSFELASEAKTLYRGNILLAGKKMSWSKGLQRSYLRLRCEQKDAKEVLKTYSTVDLFDGLRLSYQLVENKVKLSVTHSTVKSRLAEIHALSSGECREMLPIVTSATQSYSLPVNGSGETLLFSEDVTFKYTLQPLTKTR